MPEIPVSLEVQQMAVAAMQMIVVTAMNHFVAGPVAISNTHFMELWFLEWLFLPRCLVDVC